MQGPNKIADVAKPVVVNGGMQLDKASPFQLTCVSFGPQAGALFGAGVDIGGVAFGFRINLGSGALSTWPLKSVRTNLMVSMRELYFGGRDSRIEIYSAERLGEFLREVRFPSEIATSSAAPRRSSLAPASAMDIPLIQSLLTGSAALSTMQTETKKHLQDDSVKVRLDSLEAQLAAVTVTDPDEKVKHGEEQFEVACITGDGQIGAASVRRWPGFDFEVFRTERPKQRIGVPLNVTWAHPRPLVFARKDLSEFLFLLDNNNGLCWYDEAHIAMVARSASHLSVDLECENFALFVTETPMGRKLGLFNWRSRYVEFELSFEDATSPAHNRVEVSASAVCSWQYLGKSEPLALVAIGSGELMLWRPKAANNHFARMRLDCIDDLERVASDMFSKVL